MLIFAVATGSHPIHSTALLRAKLRRDTEARKEWFGPGGIGEAHRHLMTFGEYAKRREAAGSRREMMADIRAQLASTSASAAFSTSTRSSASTSQRGGSSGSYRREDVVHTTLPALLTTFESMTKQGQRPTRKAYLELLQAAAEYSNEREAVRTGSGDNTDGHPSLSGSGGSGNDTGLGWKIAWSAWEDARLGGLELGIEAFDLLVKAAMPHPRLIPSLLYYAQANPYLYAQLSEETYDRLLRTPALQSNLETTLALMTEMRRAGHRPSSDRMNQAAKMACEWDQPKVALDLCERLEREVGGGAQAVEAQTWLEVLRCSARNQFVSESCKPNGTFLSYSLRVFVTGCRRRARMGAYTDSPWIQLCSRRRPLAAHDERGRPSWFGQSWLGGASRTRHEWCQNPRTPLGADARCVLP